MLLFAQEGLPQVLSDELLLLVLQMFKLTDKPQLRIGYNSMGADCIINNLHMHVFTTQNLFQLPDGAEDKGLPIETADKRLFFKSNLQHKDKDEINMFNCGVRFGEVLNFPIKALLISPDILSEDTSLEDAQEALSHACGVAINMMIDLNIPHNILVTDEGMTVFVIPRKFDMLIEKVPFYTSFESLCGFVKYKTSQSFAQASEDETCQLMSEKVSLSSQEFDDFKQNLMSKFMKEYESSVVEITEGMSQLKV